MVEKISPDSSHKPIYYKGPPPEKEISSFSFSSLSTEREISTFDVEPLTESSGKSSEIFQKTFKERK